jgi:Cu2+-exporting ATPase
LAGFVHGIFFPAPIENTSACLGRGIGGIRALFKVAGVRRRTQRVILVFSAVYNLLAVGLAVAGKMHPLLVAMLMPVNSLATLAIVTGGMRRVFRSSS